HSEIQVLKNDEEIIDLHEKWWGGENIRISKAELEELLKVNSILRLIRDVRKSRVWIVNLFEVI
ncbi:hypothetical protein Q604_UNBC17497G0001, partial [human gut metagenome]